ncbi:hypothetical protein BH18ACI1_BH18ACI1_24460 [soil metagenome]
MAVELGHEREAEAVRRGHLLGPELGQGVVVTDAEGIGEGQHDLVLAEIGLPQQALHLDPGTLQRGGECAQEAAGPTRVEQGVVAAVLRHRHQVAITAPPRLLVGLPESRNSSSVPTLALHPRASSSASWLHNTCLGETASGAPSRCSTSQNARTVRGRHGILRSDDRSGRMTRLP